MRSGNLTLTVKQMNRLYIITRKRYILQTQHGYITLDGYNNEKVWTLNDSMIERHLKGINTYGIFNGNSVNKFITFDIDFADDFAHARWATLKIIYTLVNDFNIPSADIHVSFSGHKGYHVDLFFDSPIKAEYAKSFYECVIKMTDLPREKVEFRPTKLQAVKLPLGIHQKTQERCWFVDRETLEPIESFDYLQKVEPMDHLLILDALINLTPEQEADYNSIVENTKANEINPQKNHSKVNGINLQKNQSKANEISLQKNQSKANEILQNGQLINCNTRHDTTVLLATFCNTNHYEYKESVDLIMSILCNTPRTYFSKDSTPEYWKSETERIVKLAMEHNYKLGNSTSKITVYKSEIISILKVGTFRQKQLAYAMLITSKLHGSTFFLSTKTAMRMLETNSHQTIQSAIEKLVKVGFIEYVRKGEIDKIKSIQKGHAYYLPNLYRILIEEPCLDEKCIEISPSLPLVDVSYLLLNLSDIKKVVKRSEFKNRWIR